MNPNLKTGDDWQRDIDELRRVVRFVAVGFIALAFVIGLGTIGHFQRSGSPLAWAGDYEAGGGGVENTIGGCLDNELIKADGTTGNIQCEDSATLADTGIARFAAVEINNADVAIYAGSTGNKSLILRGDDATNGAILMESDNDIFMDTDDDGDDEFTFSESGGGAELMFSEAGTVVGKIIVDTGTTPDYITLISQSGKDVQINAQAADVHILSQDGVVLPKEESATPSATACADGLVGQLIYVDDTDDGVTAELCVCVDKDDGTTFDWVKLTDGSTACTGI